MPTASENPTKPVLAFVSLRKPADTWLLLLVGESRNEQPMKIYIGRSREVQQEGFRGMQRDYAVLLVGSARPDAHL